MFCYIFSYFISVHNQNVTCKTGSEIFVLLLFYESVHAYNIFKNLFIGTQKTKLVFYIPH